MVKYPVNMVNNMVKMFNSSFKYFEYQCDTIELSYFGSPSIRYKLDRISSIKNLYIQTIIFCPCFAPCDRLPNNYYYSNNTGLTMQKFGDIYEKR